MAIKNILGLVLLILPFSYGHAETFKCEVGNSKGVKTLVTVEFTPKELEDTSKKDNNNNSIGKVLKKMDLIEYQYIISITADGRGAVNIARVHSASQTVQVAAALVPASNGIFMGGLIDVENDVVIRCPNQ